MEFSRQEYWSGLPFPTPGDLPNPAIEPESLTSPALGGGFFTVVPPGSQYFIIISMNSYIMVSVFCKILFFLFEKNLLAPFPFQNLF